MARKLTYDEVKYFIEVESDSKCKLISEEYIGNKNSLKIQCSCEELFDASFNTFKNNFKRQCNICGHEKIAESRRKSSKKFLDEFYSIRDKDEFMLLSDYVSSDKEIEIFHRKCCTASKLLPYNALIVKHCCDFCSRKAIESSNRHDYKDVENFILSEGYKLLSKKYKNVDEKIQFQCNKGHIFPMSFDSFKNAGQRCPECAYLKNIERLQERRTDRSEIIEILMKTNLELVSFSEEYVGNNSLFEVICPDGHLFNMSGAMLKRSSKCRICSMTSGEQQIHFYLKALKVASESQFKMLELRNKLGNILPIDFLILNILSVEYDGEYHFYKVDYSYENSEEKFAKVQRHDLIKNQYCIDNNIPLLRIPYWEFNNIEVILESALMHFNIIEKRDSYDASRFIEYLVDENWDHDEYLSKCPKNQKGLDKQVG